MGLQVFKTSKQVTQAVKNVGRLRTILSVFARHGLDTFLLQMGFERDLFHSGRDASIESLTLPERVRMAFETLGPTFVKLGQLLANRPDMVPDEFLEEFRKLQDNVSPLPFEVIRTQIERELNGPVDRLFVSINPTALASASVGQVHEATLPTGEDVVVKVQRPDIEKIIQTDISILRFLAQAMEKYLPEVRVLSPIQIVEEFAAALTYELDYVVEANTTQKVRENFREHPRFVIPVVYRSHSSHKVLTLQRLQGIRINNVSAVRGAGINPRELVELGVRGFFKMLMQDGLFHGDLHGGNLFAMRNSETGEAQIGVIDFGIVGRLSHKSRESFSRMLMALVMEDYETLCYEYADLGASAVGIDFEGFQRDVRNSLSPYLGLSIKDVNVGLILINSTKIAVRYNIKIPGDWMVVFKAIFTMEGLGRQLDPEFDLLSIGNDLVKTALKDRYSVGRVSREFAFLARDLNALLQVLPRQVRWMFRKFNSNDFAFELKFREAEIIRRQVEKSFHGLGLSVLTAAFFMGAAISLHLQTERLVLGQYPIPAILFFLMGLGGLLRLWMTGWK